MQGTKPFSLAIPTKWADVSLTQYLRLLTEKNTPVLSVLTGLTLAQISALETVESIAATIANALSFVSDESELLALESAPDLMSVGSATYGQLLLATQYISEKEGQPLFVCAPYIYALYTSRRISGKHSDARIEAMQAALMALPITEVFANLVFYTNDLATFHERYASDEEENEAYTDAEIDAGFDTIAEQFSYFATLDVLAGGDPIKYEQLLDIDADTIMQKIRLVQAQQQAQKKLDKIQAAKS